MYQWKGKAKIKVPETLISLEEFPIERKQQKTMKNSTHLPERCIDEQGYKGLRMYMC